MFRYSVTNNVPYLPLLQDLSDVQNFQFDPLPPLDSIDSYPRGSDSGRTNLDDPSILVSCIKILSARGRL